MTTNNRDELADVFTGYPAGVGRNSQPIMRGRAQEIADAILAAGYRKLDMAVAPIGYEVTAPMVQEVWDTFVKPNQDAGNPQSGEMRVLMAILRGVFAALEPQP